MDHEDSETLPQGSQDNEMPAKAKAKPVEYPEDIPRLTRLGLCTYGIKTGPLPDGTDWTKFGLRMIREQLSMRDMPTGGKKNDLIDRLNNWKTSKPEIVDVRSSQQDFGHIDRSSNAKGERRFWVDRGDKRYASSVKKAMQENMYIIKQVQDGSFGQDRVCFKVNGSGDKVYNVQIAGSNACDCPGAIYNRTSNCKHIIYVLTHVFRAPAELLPQKTLFAEEVAKLIANAPKVLPTEAEIESDPAFRDGIPKAKDGKSCPVCFKDFGDNQTVCCAKCGHHIHSDCFCVFARESSGWGTLCPVCRASWAANDNQ